VGTRALSQIYIGPGAKLITHPQVVQRLRMSGATPLLPLYALMSWAEIASPFHLQTKSTHINYSVSIFVFRNVPLELPLPMYFLSPHTGYISYKITSWTSAVIDFGD
jgi:hypothetical protein